MLYNMSVAGVRVVEFGSKSSKRLGSRTVPVVSTYLLYWSYPNVVNFITNFICYFVNSYLINIFHKIKYSVHVFESKNIT